MIRTDYGLVNDCYVTDFEIDGKIHRLSIAREIAERTHGPHYMKAEERRFLESLGHHPH